MKKTQRIILLGSAFVLLFAGCGKKNDASGVERADKIQGSESEQYTEDGELEETECAEITLDYIGAAQLPERDVVTFAFPDTAEIMGIAATDREENTLTLPPGYYMVLSNYLDSAEFEIEDASQKFIVHADYEAMKFSIEEIK